MAESLNDDQPIKLRSSNFRLHEVWCRGIISCERTRNKCKLSKNCRGYCRYQECVEGVRCIRLTHGLAHLIRLFSATCRPMPPRDIGEDTSTCGTDYAFSNPLGGRIEKVSIAAKDSPRRRNPPGSNAHVSTSKLHGQESRFGPILSVIGGNGSQRMR